MKVKISLVVVLATLMATTLAFGQGFNLVSWPLIVHDTGIQPAFADSMGTGCQITGGFPSAQSDAVEYFNAATELYTSAWYKVGGPGPQNVWQGDLTTIEPDKAYWITILTAHPAVTLTMTGSVASTSRLIPIQPGFVGPPARSAFNFVGSCFAVPCSLKDAGLVASGFTGGFPSSTSDLIQYFDSVTGWKSAWYKVGGPGPQNVWQGDFFTLEPGFGYVIEVLNSHTTWTLWTYPVPPDYSKGGKVVLGGEAKTRIPMGQSSYTRALRSTAPATYQSLAPEKVVESKKTR